MLSADMFYFEFVDGKLPELSKSQRYSLNAKSREQARVQHLAEEMVTLHEEWAEIDAAQEVAAKKLTEAPKIGKKTVVSK